MNEIRNTTFPCSLRFGKKSEKGRKQGDNIFRRLWRYHGISFFDTCSEKSEHEGWNLEIYMNELSRDGWNGWEYPKTVKTFQNIDKHSCVWGGFFLKFFYRTQIILRIIIWVSTPRRKVVVVFKNHHSEIYIYICFLNKRSYKENSAEVLTNRIYLYYLHLPKFVSNSNVAFDTKEKKK